MKSERGASTIQNLKPSQCSVAKKVLWDSKSRDAFGLATICRLNKEGSEVSSRGRWVVGDTERGRISISNIQDRMRGKDQGFAKFLVASRTWVGPLKI